MRQFKRPRRPRALSERQESFCQRWVVHQNATQAFVQSYPHAAKWKRANARKGACRLMKCNDIVERIGVLMKAAIAAQDAAFDAWLRREYGLNGAVEVVVSDTANGAPSLRP